MARFDFMPYRNAVTGNAFPVYHGKVTSAQTFDVGELVGVVAAGTISGAPEDATEALIADFAATGTTQPIFGVACYGPGTATSAADPTSRANINPKTGTTFATGDDVALWIADAHTEFITDNFLAAGGAATATPAITDIGETYEVTYGTVGTPDAGWAIEQTAGTAGTDLLALVTDVLDSNKRSLQGQGNSSSTAVYLVFKLKSRQ